MASGRSYLTSASTKLNHNKMYISVILFTVTEVIQVSEKKTVNDLRGEINTAHVLKLSGLMSQCCSGVTLVVISDSVNNLYNKKPFCVPLGCLYMSKH